MPSFIQEGSSENPRFLPRGPISLLSGLVEELGCSCLRRRNSERTQWVSSKIWIQERSSRGHSQGHSKNHSCPAIAQTPGK